MSEPKPSALSSRSRQQLKAMANELKPTVQIGSAGLTESVVAATNQALKDHELIKVKLGKGSADDRHAKAEDLAQSCEAELCQVVGRVIVLYRRRDRDLPGRARIVLEA